MICDRCGSPGETIAGAFRCAYRRCRALDEGEPDPGPFNPWAQPRATVGIFLSDRAPAEEADAGEVNPSEDEARSDEEPAAVDDEGD